MKYFFVLGNNTALSIAELAAVFNLGEANKKNWEFIAGQNIFIVESNKKIQTKKIINQLGGIIKIGEIKESERKNNFRLIIKKSLRLIKPGFGKFKFGISFYGQSNFNTKALAMEIKKFLREKKINSRWVTSREKILSSVVVGQNKLTSSGIELSLIAKNDKLYIGETLAVQPFKELSFRDYGRPYRDDFSGMLPPKLAQIMLNLSDAKTSDIILDPFCGSGTILSEALLMKFENVIGSDISKKAIDDSRRNIQWINKNWEIKIEKLKLYNSSAAELSKKILPKSIDAIITEPYLGPQRGKINIRNAIAEIETLYSKTLNEFKKILKPNGRIAIIFPIFRSNHGSRYILPELSGYKIINLIPKNLRKNKNIYLTKRDSIIYGRPGQKIWREIIILQKNNLKILFNLNSKN